MGLAFRLRLYCLTFRLCRRFALRLGFFLFSRNLPLLLLFFSSSSLTRFLKSFLLSRLTLFCFPLPCSGLFLSLAFFRRCALGDLLSAQTLGTPANTQRAAGACSSAAAIDGIFR
jgi:hypothetical protein